MKFFSDTPIQRTLFEDVPGDDEHDGPEKLSAQKKKDIEQAMQKLPDDDMHRKWKQYRFGDDHHEAGDKKLRADIMYQFKNMMHSAANEAREKGAPVGEAQRFVRQKIYDAIDNYDPTKGSSSRPAKLSTYVYRNIWPNGPNAPSIANRVVAKMSDFKPVNETRFRRLMPMRKHIRDYEQMHGHEPTDAYLADKMGLPEEQIKRMRFESADEYNTDNTINDDDNQADFSLNERDAIMTAYQDFKFMGRDQHAKLMEYMFPEILDGEKPAKPFNAGGGQWAAQQLGVPAYKVSRMKNKIRDKIQEVR